MLNQNSLSDGQTNNDVSWMGFLTDDERLYAATMVTEAAMDTHPRPTVHSLNAELLQLEHTVAHLTKAYRNALINYEPITSPYIQELQKKLVAMADRRDELESQLAERREVA